MRRYIIKRIGLMFILILGMTFIVFASLYMSSGDPAEMAAGASARLGRIACNCHGWPGHDCQYR